MKDTDRKSLLLTITSFLNSRSSLLLPAAFIILWFCSAAGFYRSVSYKSETETWEGTAKTAADAAGKELRSLNGKSAAYRLNNINLGSLSECSQTDISPFYRNADESSAKLIPAEVPPEVKVRAVGVLGELKVAILDIGAEEGRMIGEGEVFGEKGRVLRIDSGGVIWAWGPSQYRSLIWE